MTSQGLLLALFAGSMAALASVCAKLATSYDEANNISENIWEAYSHFLGIEFPMMEEETGKHEKTVLAVRLCGVVGIFLCNGLMWTLFTKSLQLCSSSVDATVTNTAGNFLVTAVLSRLMFQERLPVLWWLGSCCILLGLLLIHRGGRQSQAEQEKKKT
ncbi:transmembrane protein 42-like [Haliotis rubra]|uniref:transmembrane protein 42-like n=1 Tax=Haliotis rubra TaxID=36100 RepID=UPI001EE5CAEB|nr:transmembrane protein 42-like [Haliotis rubra]